MIFQVDRRGRKVFFFFYTFPVDALFGTLLETWEGWARSCSCHLRGGGGCGAARDNGFMSPVATFVAPAAAIMAPLCERHSAFVTQQQFRVIQNVTDWARSIVA